MLPLACVGAIGHCRLVSWLSIAMATEVKCAGPLHWLKLSHFLLSLGGICPNFLWGLRPSTPWRRVPAAQTRGELLRESARRGGRTLMACSLLRPSCHQVVAHGPAAFTLIPCRSLIIHAGARAYCIAGMPCSACPAWQCLHA